MNGYTSIILVTHNQLEFTKLCVESIERHSAEPYELIVVDNGSTDGSVEWAKREGETIEDRGSRIEDGGPEQESAVSDHGAERNGPVRVIVAANAENRGFPAAANQGFRAASGRQIVLLNNDTIVTAGWLGRMLKALDRNQQIGMVGPCSNFVSGSQCVPVPYEGRELRVEGREPDEEGRGSRMEDGGLTNEAASDGLDVRGLEEFARKWGEANEGRIVETDRLVGFCLLIRREVVDRTGLLDERFGIGNFEDDDYCRRAREAGFRLAIVPGAFVHHFGGRTFIGSGVEHGALMKRNERLYREKWAGERIEDRGLRIEDRGPLISLCMIARDNERTIGAALEVIRKYVDDIVVVDTGSKDRTPEIAASLGARVFHFDWCDDFSAARNESIRHALGEWIFWMDTDDVIDAENARNVRELAEDGGSRIEDREQTTESRVPILGYLMKVRCPGVGKSGDAGFIEVDQVKLFRNLPGIRFEGRIHEQVLIPIRRVGGTAAWTDIVVVHANADQSPEGRARKIERDLRILQLDHQERPDHPFVLFNLGMTLAEAGSLQQELGNMKPSWAPLGPSLLEQEETEATENEDSISFVASCSNCSASYFQRAIEFLWQSVGRSGDDDSHLRKTYALLVSSYRQLGRHVTAWETCLKGLKQFPDDPELRFRQAVMLRDFGNLPDAARAFEDLLALRNGRHLSSVDHAIQGSRARQNLANVYAELGEFAKAEEQWRRVVEEVPNDRAIRERQCRLLFEHFAPAAAEPAFRELIARDPQNAGAHHNLGSILYKLGRFDESQVAYRQSLELRPDSVSTYLHLGYALREAGKRDEAVSVWEKCLTIEPGNIIATEELERAMQTKE